MTFEEFENASPQTLREHAKACFDEPKTIYMTGDLVAVRLLEAQFYMSEMDRRQGEGDRRFNRRIALRDFILEAVVILLIGVEIALAIKQGRDEDRLMDKQNGILTGMQTSALAEAETLKTLTRTMDKMNGNASTTAETLRVLKSTTVTMNQGIHDQLSLFYDPSIALTYDTEKNRMNFMNTGRTALKLKALKMNGEMKNLGGTKLIAAGTIQYVEVENEYKSISSGLPKGAVSSVPVEAHLESEIGKHFVMTGALLFVWQNDKVTVHPQTISVIAEQ